MNNLEYFDEYTKQYNSKETAMIRMILIKIKATHGFKTTKELADLLGVSVKHLDGVMKGKITPSKLLVQGICFVAGVSINDFNMEYESRYLDEYTNKNQHLIIDGVDYGKLNFTEGDNDE